MKLKNSALILMSASAFALAAGGCNQPTSGGSSSGSTGGSASKSSSSSSSGSTTTTTTTSTINALQVVLKADPTGSFDSVSVPVAGGTSVKAARVYKLDGTLITTSNIPTWFSEARVFLTSTRTSGANPASPSGSNTPCAYFDTFSDNNPDTSGFYTIDGYYSSTLSTGGTDVDQCAGTASGELNQLGMYVKVDRRFMNSTDKLQIIVKAKPLDEPNTAVTSSSCVVGGFFDASACVNQLFTLSMRTAPAAATKPFYILFPSAKALDLLSESVLLPINIDTSITTISIDRVKGGAIFYGLTVIRMQ